MVRCLILIILIATHCQAQSDSVLANYLTTHRYNINLEKDSSTTLASDAAVQMLDKAMIGKQLLVYAEGYNHKLELHGDLRRMFAAYLGPKGLRYYFEEAARSWVADINMHNDDNIQLSPFYSNYSFYNKRYRRQEKQLHSQFPGFEYAAIDFERKDGFHHVIKMICSTIDKNKLPELYAIAPFIRDSTYVGLSPHKFVSFYTEERDRFFTDSNNYKRVLGNLYPHYLYLMSDPMPSSFNNNRNRMMAEHLLLQIGDAPQNEKYLLSIGNGHAMYRDGVTKSTLGNLRDSKQLENKILLVNFYCDSCIVPGDNGGLSYINGEVLNSCREAAKSDITLFDLTTLPEQYSYLKAKSDLLVFARKAR